MVCSPNISTIESEKLGSQKKIKATLSQKSPHIESDMIEEMPMGGEVERTSSAQAGDKSNMIEKPPTGRQTERTYPARSRDEDVEEITETLSMSYNIRYVFYATMFLTQLLKHSETSSTGRFPAGRLDEYE